MKTRKRLEQAQALMKEATALSKMNFEQLAVNLESLQADLKPNNKVTLEALSKSASEYTEKARNATGLGIENIASAFRDYLLQGKTRPSSEMIAIAESLKKIISNLRNANSGLVLNEDDYKLILKKFLKQAFILEQNKSGDLSSALLKALETLQKRIADAAKPTVSSEPKPDHDGNRHSSDQKAKFK